MGRFDNISLGGAFAASRNGSSEFSLAKTDTSKKESGLVASGVISGIAEIATGFVNAQRTERAYEFNARMAGLRGRMRRLSANVEIQNIRKRANDILGVQMAAYAKAGVKMAGSPAAVMKASLKEAELDIIYTNISAEYDVGLTRTQAGISRMYGGAAKYEAIRGASKSLLEMHTVYELSKDKYK